MLFLFAFSLLTYQQTLHTPQVEVASATAQGQAILMQLQFGQPLKPEDKVAVHFLGSDLPCYAEARNAECRMAVPADAPPGDQQIQIIVDEQTVSSATVRIEATAYPTEPLPLTPEKKSLMAKEDDAAQIKKIRAALHRESARKKGSQAFLKPVDGPVESEYGERRVVDGKLRAGYHRGLDLGAPEGAPIAASQDGTVALAGPFTEEGNMVMIDHGHGIVTVYMHLSKIKAKVGRRVRRGEVIGKVGSTGIANTSHLHFGVYVHGTPINPLYWFKNARWSSH